MSLSVIPKLGYMLYGRAMTVSHCDPVSCKGWPTAGFPDTGNGSTYTYTRVRDGQNLPSSPGDDPPVSHRVALAHGARPERPPPSPLLLSVAAGRRFVAPAHNRTFRQGR